MRNRLLDSAHSITTHLTTITSSKLNDRLQKGLHLLGVRTLAEHANTNPFLFRMLKRQKHTRSLTPAPGAAWLGMNLRGLRFIPVLLAVGCAAPRSGESETLLTGRNVLVAREIGVALQGTVNFSRHVKPILEAKCVACHGRESQPRGLRFDNYESAIRSGALGVFIVPGHPERSPFLTTIKSAHTSTKSMPPVGERLTSEEVEILKRWIQQGARWPSSE